MHTIDIPTMKQMVSHIAIAHNEPVCFHGQPGAGKTEGIYQSAEENNALVCDVRLGQYDSVDLRGIPVPDNERKQTCWYAPLTLPFLGNPIWDVPENKDRIIILFLDELGHASTAVQGPTMQLVNEGSIGEHKLMPNVRIVAATNRDGDRAVHNRMSSTVANRFTHAEIALSVDAWCEWAVKSGKPQEGVAFMQFRKNLLSTFEEALKTGAKAFATPRTWCKALAYYADPKMPEHVKQAAMAGSIGEGPAAEFWGFIKIWAKMPPLSSIEKNPGTIELPKEAAMRYAVTVAISGALNKKNVSAFSVFLNRMDPEFSILAWQLAIVRDIEITSTSEFIDFSKRHRQILQR